MARKIDREDGGFVTDGLRGLVSILGESRFVGRGNRSQRCNALKTSRLAVRSYFLLIQPSYLYITYSVVQTSNIPHQKFCLNFSNFLYFPNRLCITQNQTPIGYPKFRINLLELHRNKCYRNETRDLPLQQLRHCFPFGTFR